MSPEKQRIAIARACGYRFGLYDGIEQWFNTARGEGTNAIASSLPDYLGDLNAIAKAEKMLEDTQREHLRMYLNEVCDYGRAWKDSECCPEIVHASAAQRAEAFLRTLGLWEEEEKL